MICVRWFDKGLIDIQSNDLLEEMKTFVAEDSRAFNAVVGSHDDLVSACWLCIAGMKSAGRFRKERQWTD